jgi:hypothetical protein
LADFADYGHNLSFLGSNFSKFAAKLAAAGNFATFFGAHAF